MIEELTVKQRKFVKVYLETGNASQAALKAGYAHRQRGAELVSKSVIQDAFQELLDNAGLTDQKIAQSLNEGLAATKIQNVNIVLKRKKDGELEVQDTDDFIEVPDYGVRHKYLETLLKLKQKLSSIDEETVGKGPTLETYFIEIIKRHNGALRSQGIDGFKITRTEHRTLDQFVAK